MRSARTTPISLIPAGTAVAVCVLAGLVAGCGTTGNLKNGFFNAGELGRFEKEPLMMPIVSTLDPSIEEPNDEFTQATDVRPEDREVIATDYVVGHNDLINVSITDLQGPGIETVKTMRVTESGNITLPLIGQVRAEGLTEAQLQNEVADVYRQKNILPNAQVAVTVAEARQRTFSILGAVSRPGQYQIIQADFKILDALVIAGDVNNVGMDYLYVIRREDLANRATTPSGPSTAPGMTTPAPGTTPGTPPQPNDVLTPRSQANPMGLQKVALLLQNAGAPGATPPASAPAAPGAGLEGGEGRYIIIDGKPVLVGAQPGAPTGAAPAAAGAPPAPAVPAPALEPTTPNIVPTTGAPTTTGAGFEFNSPGVNENTRIIRVPLPQLRNGDLRYNIVIRPMDLIVVPAPTIGEYYMDGHVSRTGVYSLTGRKINLQQAMAAAGGFDQLAIPTRTEIIRRIGTDKQVYAVVDLDKVFSGQQPDIYLKPNDIVRVGTNAFAPFMAAFRNGFRITYGFGFLYDRNYAPIQNNNR